MNNVLHAPPHTSGMPSFGAIIQYPPCHLKPWPTNPRKHPPNQLAKLKASIVHFGFYAPVIVDENYVILAGHGKTLAALELGLTTVPVRVVYGLTLSKKRALVIADNKMAHLSTWDEALLKTEIEVLIQDDFAIELTAFSTAEIDIMMDGDGKKVAASDVADLQESDLSPVHLTRPGDLWILGKHRLLCANALLESSYQMLMQSDVSDMVFTDEPYNVPINGHVGGKGKVQHAEFAMASGEMSPAEFTAFLATVSQRLHDHTRKGAVIFRCMDWRHLREMLDACEPLFGPMSQLCVWVKDNAGMGSFYRSQHELVCVFTKAGGKRTNHFELGQFGRYRSNIWTYPGANTFTGKIQELLATHPTPKNCSMIADAIRDCSDRRDIILDPFAGSGTILIACERTGRYARAMELEPKYVDAAIQRWQRVTGKQAILASTGQTWDEVRNGRMASSLLEVAHG